MRTFVKHALWGALIAGGVSLLGATAANAAETNGDDGLLSGTQVVAPITAPVEVSDNSLSLLGDSFADSSADADPAPAPETDAQTSGVDGTASGTQVVADADAPVTVTDNSVAVLGTSSTDGDSTAPATSEDGTTNASTTGSDGTASGTQAVADADAPVSVTDNSVAVLGTPSTDGDSTASATSEDGTTDATTDGADGIASGTQVLAPTDAPITVTDNSVAVLGTSSTGGDSTATAASEDGTDYASTSGTDGIASGTQVLAPADAPVTVTDNSVAVLGTSSTDGDTTAPAEPTDVSTDGLTDGLTEGLTDGEGALFGFPLLARAAVDVTGDSDGISGALTFSGDSFAIDAEGTTETADGESTTGDGMLFRTARLMFAAASEPAEVGSDVVVDGSVSGDPAPQPRTEPAAGVDDMPATDVVTSPSVIASASAVLDTRTTGSNATGSSALAASVLAATGGDSVAALGLLAGLMLLSGGVLVARIV